MSHRIGILLGFFFSFFIVAACVHAQTPTTVPAPQIGKLTCTITPYRVENGYTLPYKFDGIQLVQQGATVSPGSTIVYVPTITNTLGKPAILQSVDFASVAGSMDPITILGMYTANGTCTSDPNKHAHCDLSYQFSQIAGGPAQFMIQTQSSSTQPKTEPSISFTTNLGTTTCTAFLWISSPSITPTLPAPTNVRVTSYADSANPMIKYATISWDPVAYATKYNLYESGSTQTYFDSTPTNAYILKFPVNSSWYFTISAVDANGNSGTKSSVVTVQYPNPKIALTSPRNLRVAQFESTSNPDIRLAHLVWDPVDTATSYALYLQQGETFYLDRSVNTNDAFVPINNSKVYYYAVAARQGDIESQKSDVLPININVPLEIVTTPQPIQANSDISQLKQDVKILQGEVVTQQQQQAAQTAKQTQLEQIVNSIRNLFRRVFGISI